MGFPYLNNRSWAEVTREERYFCAQLFFHIKSDPKRFISFLNQLPNVSLKLPLNPNKVWEVAFEVCLYRDLFDTLRANDLSIKIVNSMPDSPQYPQKRTFDLCLFAADEIVLIEAKAFEAIDARQIERLAIDRDCLIKDALKYANKQLGSDVNCDDIRISAFALISTERIRSGKAIKLLDKFTKSGTLNGWFTWRDIYVSYRDEAFEYANGLKRTKDYYKRLVIDLQKSWAESRGIRYSEEHRVAELQANLFQGIDDQMIAEFKSGSGKELKDKMPALHSSSALVVNVFDYWRHTSQMVEFLHSIDPRLSRPVMSYESKIPLGWGGGPANLDVYIEDSEQKMLIGIESKFTEYLTKSKSTPSQKYIERSDMYEGLEHMHELMVSIHRNSKVFTALDVKQIVAHLLSLKRRAKEKGYSFKLLYLWWCPTSPIFQPIVAQHFGEIADFQATLANQADVVFMTYQELLDRNADLLSQEKHREYAAYIKSRYC